MSAAARETVNTGADTPVEGSWDSRPEVVGWQGIRCVLPPDWSVTGLSMERESGYVRIDAPGDSSLSVQIKWTGTRPKATSTVSLYSMSVTAVRGLLKRPGPTMVDVSLRENLERLLKDTGRQAKKSHTAFETVIKPERAEGPGDERQAINFSWTGGGRGQGKIWRCGTCGRVVVAQVIGLQKDQAGIAAVASQLFATLEDHGRDGYDLWALYGLKAELPTDFNLESQTISSGHLRLAFTRSGERLIIDRWALANTVLKRFTATEWFRRNAWMGLKRLAAATVTTSRGHEVERYSGSLTIPGRLKAFRESKGSLKRMPSRYSGGAWVCTETNRIIAVQAITNRNSPDEWEAAVSRCLCH